MVCHKMQSKAVGRLKMASQMFVQMKYAGQMAGVGKLAKDVTYWLELLVIPTSAIL